MEQERLNLEPAVLRLGDLVLHHGQVPVVHVHPAAVDGQPRTPVEHPAPTADLRDFTGPVRKSCGSAGR